MPGLSTPFLRVLQGVPAPMSLSYHEFADPDTDAGKILNASPLGTPATVTLRQSETAHGLAWAVLPDDWTGGTVSVSAVDRYTSLAATTMTDLTGAVDAADGHRVYLDWPGTLVKPVGDWVFYARLSRAGLVDVTSGVLVSIVADVA